ncbi:WbqC family protein [Aquimarina agarivorans]|uniref:WbqC family protein n=1 Tax=Aquimarina agarivorans TaxID=980584 RepID=UPI000248F86B|nr:WbqC family protein [Aquimarina agarivorans]
MSNILTHPSYFGSIAQYVAIAKAKKVIYEDCDNYQKQTLRNRTYIYGANGTLLLNLPILHSGIKGKKRLYKEIEIEHQFNTLKIHWKSLESAYRTSPYFEFYEDDIAPLFEEKPKYLLDFNYKCSEFIFDSLQLTPEISKTTSFELTPSEKTIDYRSLVNPKEKAVGTTFKKYIQVFESKHGFIPNLSILDLLFNEGPNALTYLENQSI